MVPQIMVQEMIREVAVPQVQEVIRHVLVPQLPTSTRKLWADLDDESETDDQGWLSGTCTPTCSDTLSDKETIQRTPQSLWSETELEDDDDNSEGWGSGACTPGRSGTSTPGSTNSGYSSRRPKEFLRNIPVNREHLKKLQPKQGVQQSSSFEGSSPANSLPDYGSSFVSNTVGSASVVSDAVASTVSIIDCHTAPSNFSSTIRPSKSKRDRIRMRKFATQFQDAM